MVLARAVGKLASGDVLRGGPRRVTVIGKALRDPLGHIQDLVRLPQERRPRVGCQPSAIKSACDSTSTRVLKYEAICCTLCHDGILSTVKGKSL